MRDVFSVVRTGNLVKELAKPVRQFRSIIRNLYNICFARALISDSQEAELLDEFFSGQNDGRFCDIGANRANTAVSKQFLDKGWTGLAVDPIQENCDDLRRNGYQVICAAVTNGEAVTCKKQVLFVAGDNGRKSSLQDGSIDPGLPITQQMVDLMTLAELLEQFELTRLDLLSVDVEGHELDVLSTLPKGYYVGLILVEDWARDTKLHRFMTSLGYKRVRRTGYNSWYVPRSRLFNVSLFGSIQLFFKLSARAPFRRLKFEIRKGLHGKGL